MTTAIHRMPPRTAGRHVRPPGPGTRSVRHAGTGVLLAVLVAGLALLVVPRVAGVPALVVTSGSMGSAVPTGSVVLVRPEPSARVRVGDVLLMREDATMVLHRVVERTDAMSVRTKGDANPTADPNPYRLGATAYVAVADIPWLGYAIGALRSPAGLVVLAVLVLLAVLVPARRNRAATVRRPGYTPAGSG